MHHQAYLVACYMLGMQYHSGQWSNGYRLLCLADQRANREHPGWDIGRTVEQLSAGELYQHGGVFRNAVAYYLNKLRKYRHSL